MDLPSIISVLPCKDLIPRFRSAPMEDLVPQLRAARGEGALTLLGVLLERGADIGAADLVSIAQSITSDLVYSERRSDVPDELICRICAALIASAMGLGTPRIALQPVTALVKMVAPHSLTGVHVDFVKLALLTRTYSAAATLLDATPLYSVASGVSTRDVLLFHYYAGLVFCGAEAWASATGMFKICVSLPGPGTSAIQVEAYKKLLLTLMIDPRNIAQSTGSLFITSSAVTASLPRHRRDGLLSIARGYVDFCRAFECLDAILIRKLVTEHSTIFERDGNNGLVHTVLDSTLPLRQLLQLRRVYSVVPLGIVVTELGLQDASLLEPILLHMISRGGLHAKIDQRSNVLIFSPHESSSEGFTADDDTLAGVVQARIDDALSVLARLKQADRDLQISDAFKSRLSAIGGGKRDSRRGHHADARGVVSGAAGVSAAEIIGGREDFDDDDDMLQARAASLLT